MASLAIINSGLGAKINYSCSVFQRSREELVSFLLEDTTHTIFLTIS